MPVLFPAGLWTLALRNYSRAMPWKVARCIAMPGKETSFMKHRQLPSDITVMVLAGGLGTRLLPVVSDRPKVLAPVLGRSFLFYLLDHLVDFSVAQVVLLTGYRAEQVEQAIGSEYRGMSVVYS